MFLASVFPFKRLNDFHCVISGKLLLNILMQEILMKVTHPSNVWSRGHDRKISKRSAKANSPTKTRTQKRVAIGWQWGAMGGNGGTNSDLNVIKGSSSKPWMHEVSHMMTMSMMKILMMMNNDAYYARG